MKTSIETRNPALRYLLTNVFSFFPSWITKEELKADLIKYFFPNDGIFTVGSAGSHIYIHINDGQQEQERIAIITF